MRDLVMAYYFVLRHAVRSRGDLQRCLTRCRHCGIFFLAHPRNGSREDLGCPFGCRDAYRKKCSTARSTAYYRTAAGKAKKAVLNRKRRQSAKSRRSDPTAAAGRESDSVLETAGAPPAAETGFDGGIVEHVRMVVSLIERREVRRDEVVEMLERTVRQRSIGRGGRRAYILRWLAEHPP